MVGINSLTKREVDYILKIFELSGRGRVKHSALAKALGLAKPTVSLTVRRLASKGFVTASREGVMLTDKGHRVVEEALWRHGVIEVALVKLGISVEDACSAAAKMQFSVPRGVVKQIWVALGRPKSCPHGVRFPTLESNNVEKYSVCKAGSALTPSPSTQTPRDAGRRE